MLPFFELSVKLLFGERSPLLFYAMPFRRGANGLSAVWKRKRRERIAFLIKTIQIPPACCAQLTILFSLGRGEKPGIFSLLFSL